MTEQLDPLQCFIEARLPRDHPPRCLDWAKAYEILTERGWPDAHACILEDYFWTADQISRNGAPLAGCDPWVYSGWATPGLRIGEEDIPCWRYVDPTEPEPTRTWPLELIESR